MASGKDDGRNADPRAAISVMRAVEFAEGALGFDIGLSDMAAAACYSPFYFSRLFAQTTGHSPYDYLMRRRTAVAARILVSSERSLIDIALECGFGTPDTFARAFRRCFGSSPSEARRMGAYPASIARTPISMDLVEEAIARPFRPPEELISEVTTIDGIEGGSAGRGRTVEISQRDGSLRPSRPFRGIVRMAGQEAPPEYPSLSTVLPAGRQARFPLGNNLSRLAFTLEYAYRAWLPLTGRSSPPDFDIVEWENGLPAYLSLRLSP